MKKPAIYLALILLGLCLCARDAVGQTERETDFVRSMLSEVMAIQTDFALQGQDQRSVRRERIRKVILKNFDFSTMAREALGPKQWNAMNGSQRSEFTSIFQDLFLDSYSRLVLDFLKKEKIEYGGQEAGRGHTVVKTFVRRLEDRIPVQYVVEPRRDEWLVADVSIDGVSITGNYRKAFSRVIMQESYDGLLKKMRLQQKAVRSGQGDVKP